MRAVRTWTLPAKRAAAFRTIDAGSYHCARELIVRKYSGMHATSTFCASTQANACSQKALELSSKCKSAKLSTDETGGRTLAEMRTQAVIVAHHTSCGKFIAAGHGMPAGTLVAWYGAQPCGTLDHDERQSPADLVSGAPDAANQDICHEPR